MNSNEHESIDNELRSFFLHVLLGEAISTIFTLTESSIPRLDHSDSYPTLFPQIAVGIIHAAHTAYDVHPHNARLQKLTHWKIILLCNQHPEIGWAAG